MRGKASGAKAGWSARRLFAAYAAATAVPVVILGILLITMITRQANAGGIDEARDQAEQIAKTAISPQLSGRDLRTGVSPAERAALGRVVKLSRSDGLLLRLRLRSLDGKVVFSDDGTGFSLGADDEVEDAAKGEIVTRLTRLNADEARGKAGGPRVVEVYEPLQAAESGARIGVLELYVPYEPIAKDIAAGRRSLTMALGSGLALLWVTLFLVTVSVTSRLRRAGRRNAYLAGYDVLTGLPNRRTFHHEVARATKEASPQRPAAVAVLDIDRFKAINDTLGHESGDALLRHVADQLRSIVRPGDAVARLGGDEFGIVLRDVRGVKEAALTLTRVRAALSEILQLADLPLSVEVSIGFALTPDDGADVETLQRQADLAMYAAKRGHLLVTHYQPNHDQYDTTTLALVNRIPLAIEHDELVLHYQPKADARTGLTSGVEALLRWNHPTLGLLAPDRFLPAVEQTELMEPLTRWVLKHAAEALPFLDPTGQLSMAVNVSARSITRPAFAQDVLRVLSEADADPRRIILEITETSLLADPECAAETLGLLSGCGIRISIDDFGAGQTALGYLATLPIYELKIDKSFVTTMIEDERNAAIVRSVIQLGHSLGLSVTAEGVESERVRDALIAADCDTIQGYLLARPAPANVVRERLRSFEPVPVNA